MLILCNAFRSFLNIHDACCKMSDYACEGMDSCIVAMLLHPGIQSPNAA
jgi:hypothetical protein